MLLCCSKSIWWVSNAPFERGQIHGVSKVMGHNLNQQGNVLIAPVFPLFQR